MDDHGCIQQAEIATLQRICTSDIPEIKESIDKILSKFDGKNGLTSRLAVLESRFDAQKKEAPTLRRMMIVGGEWGGITSSIIVIGFFAIRAFSG